MVVGESVRRRGGELGVGARGELQLGLVRRGAVEQGVTTTETLPRHSVDGGVDEAVVACGVGALRGAGRLALPWPWRAPAWLYMTSAGATSTQRGAVSRRGEAVALGDREQSGRLRQRHAGRARRGAALCGCTGGAGMVARCKGGRLRCVAGARPRGASRAGEVVRAVAAARRAAHGECGGGAAGRWRGGRCVVEARRGAGRCAVGGPVRRKAQRRAARRARPWANEEKG